MSIILKEKSINILKKIVEVFKLLSINEIELLITKEALIIDGVDTSHATIFKGKFYNTPDNITINTDKDIVVGLSTIMFNIVLNTFSDKYEIHLISNDDIFILKQKSKELGELIYKLSTLDISQEKFDIPVYTYDNINFKSSHFNNIIKTIDVLEDGICNIKLYDNFIQFTSTGNVNNVITKMEIIKEFGDISSDKESEPISSTTVSTKYLVIYNKLWSLFDNVLVCLNKELPLVLNFKTHDQIGDTEGDTEEQKIGVNIKCYIAPKDDPVE